MVYDLQKSFIVKSKSSVSDKDEHISCFAKIIEIPCSLWEGLKSINPLTSCQYVIFNFLKQKKQTKNFLNLVIHH